MQIGSITDPVVSALKQAAQATGSDFNYLLGTAMRESSLKPQAQSASSSAAGLFQFVEQTWLGLVKDHGGKYGLSSMADSITRDEGGHYRVLNDDNRHAILDLRKNPKISALMAGEYSKSSAATMQAELGRPVCGGELYAAHFLGAEGACRLIRAQAAKPGESAALLLPAAAASNRNVFFHPDGSAKNVREVYDWAMHQPGASAPVRSHDTQNAVVTAAGASAANVEGLLASVMDWQPSGNFYTPGNANKSILSLTPGLLGVLSDAKGPLGV